MNKIMSWGNGPKFIRVSKKRYDNFKRYFGDKLESNAFMGWLDLYDWELSSGKYEEGTWEFTDECLVARHYFEGPTQERYIRIDYIKSKKYDLDTVVPKPRKKRTPKKIGKASTKIVTKFFDRIFAAQAEKDTKK